MPNKDADPMVKADGRNKPDRDWSRELRLVSEVDPFDHDSHFSDSMRSGPEYRMYDLTIGFVGIYYGLGYLLSGKTAHSSC